MLLQQPYIIGDAALWYSQGSGDCQFAPAFGWTASPYGRLHGGIVRFATFCQIEVIDIARILLSMANPERAGYSSRQKGNIMAIILRWLCLLTLCVSLTAETLDQVFQRVTAWKSATIVATDGTFLGTLEPGTAPLSVFNQFGVHGSEFGVHSVKNPFCVYGGEFGPQSPLNAFCQNPPMLCIDGVPVAFITNNKFSVKTPTLTLWQVFSLPSMYPR